MNLCNRDCRGNYTTGHQTLNILFSVVQHWSFQCKFCAYFYFGQLMLYLVT